MLCNSFSEYNNAYIMMRKLHEIRYNDYLSFFSLFALPASSKLIIHEIKVCHFYNIY